MRCDVPRVRYLVDPEGRVLVLVLVLSLLMASFCLIVTFGSDTAHAWPFLPLGSNPVRLLGGMSVFMLDPCGRASIFLSPPRFHQDLLASRPQPKM